MPLRNFIDERRSILVGGRRYRVWRPRVSTVELFLTLYPDEVALLVDGDQPIDAGAVWMLLPMFTLKGDARAPRVLGTCVDGEGSPENWPTRELAAAVLSMCDLPRIVRGLGLVRKGDASTSPANPVDQRAGIVRLALKFGITPYEVMQWPYEGLLDVTEALTHTDHEKRPQASEHSPEFMALMRAQARPVPEKEN